MNKNDEMKINLANIAAYLGNTARQSVNYASPDYIAEKINHIAMWAGNTDPIRNHNLDTTLLAFRNEILRALGIEVA